jgi:phospholipase D1/2
MGRRFKQRFHRRYGDWFPEEEEDPDAFQRPPNGTCRVQAVRSVSDWSHGVLTEKSIQHACRYFVLHRKQLSSQIMKDVQLIMEANHYIYIGVYRYHM